MNQSDFALRHDISVSAFKNYERGFQEIPFRLAVILCETYGIAADFMLLGKGPMFEADRLKNIDRVYKIIARFEKQNSQKFPEEFRLAHQNYLLRQLDKNIGFSDADMIEYLELVTFQNAIA